MEINFQLILIILYSNDQLVRVKLSIIIITPILLSIKKINVEH